MERIVRKFGQNWTLRRLFGLVIGLFVAVQSILYKDPLLGLLSSFFLFQIATNTGCFGSTACAIDYPKNITGRDHE